MYSIGLSAKRKERRKKKALKKKLTWSGSIRLGPTTNVYTTINHMQFRNLESDINKKVQLRKAYVQLRTKDNIWPKTENDEDNTCKFWRSGNWWNSRIHKIFMMFHFVYQIEFHGWYKSLKNDIETKYIFYLSIQTVLNFFS